MPFFVFYEFMVAICHSPHSGLQLFWSYYYDCASWLCIIIRDIIIFSFVRYMFLLVYSKGVGWEARTLEILASQISNLNSNSNSNSIILVVILSNKALVWLDVGYYCTLWISILDIKLKTHCITKFISRRHISIVLEALGCGLKNLKYK